MNPECPSCGVRFVRENGYFLGAVVFAYVIGVATVIPTIVLLVRYMDADAVALIGIPILQLLVLQPFIYLYSRMAWMYLDRNVNPKTWQ